MSKKTVAALLFCLFNAACTSNQYLVRPDAEISASPLQETVFVTNPEKTRQLSILEHSGLYKLADSSRAGNQLTLLRLDRDMTCGMPFIAVIFTLGLLPASVETDHHFSYRLQEGANVHTYIHDVRVKTRISVWEWFAKPFTDSEDEILAQGLALSPRRVTTDSDFIDE
ncbi:MAG: hypothetical protein AAGC84_14620 [Pseudomonas sp.]